MNVPEARRRIVLAKKQLGKVQDAAVEPDPEGVVMWGFYAFENCVTALAAWHGYRLTNVHRQKADLARQLYARGLISRDLGDELEELNTLRKDVAYGEPGPKLQEKDLQDLASELEEIVNEVESIVDSPK